jgi:hypothetical protein
MASPAPQKIVGTANPSFTSDFCNKIGHKPTSKGRYVWLPLRAGECEIAVDPDKATGFA